MAFLGAILRPDERHRQAGLTGPPGASDAVNVDLRLERELEVDDQIEAVDVETARGDVGRHQHPDAVVAEPRHHEVAVALLEIAVEAGGAQPRARQRLLDARDGRLEVAKNQSRFGRRRAQQGEERVEARALLHGVGDVRERRAGRVRLRHGEPHRLLLVGARHRLDRARIGRGEEDGLPRPGRRAQDLLHLLAEAHVEHAVGLVDDQGREVGQAQRAAGHVVEHASGRPDDYVHPALERRQLRAHGLAARGDEDLEPGLAPAELPDVTRHLRAELSRGAQDQRLGPAVVAFQVMQEGQGEGSRLAASGRGLADQILAGEQQGDGARLDRRR